jgi:putative transposase
VLKETKLLQKKRNNPLSKRRLSPDRKPQPTAPYQCLEMDFKYIYCPELRKNVYLLTVLDVFSRKVLSHSINTHMRHTSIMDLWNPLIATLGPVEHLGIRTDNGSQFICKRIAAYFADKQVKHEFTKPATPEENGHIESWHSTLAKELLNRNDYRKYDELKEKVASFIAYYNSERLHSSLDYMPPEAFMAAWEEKQISLKAERQELASPAMSLSCVPSQN